MNEISVSRSIRHDDPDELGAERGARPIETFAGDERIVSSRKRVRAGRGSYTVVTDGTSAVTP
ncbi:hypothetical protein [Halalkalicoccus salilacus]|uniref:hypothetical protein n=1 Tax=Halalkalicoccus salilacus TaxID=3117459 RepID=UPI00300F03BC